MDAMMRGRSPVARSLFLILALAGLPVVAACGGPDASPATVTDEAVEDDLLTSGRSVRVAAPVEGDVAAAGSDVVIAAPVSGYVMSAGRTVTLEESIGNDLWAAGGIVTVRNRVGNNAMLAGQRVEVEEGATVGQDAWLGGSDVRSEGRVARNLTIRASRAEIGGEVGGIVNVMAGRVRLLPDAVVRGDLVVRSPERPDIAPGAQVMGRIDYQPGDDDASGLPWAVVWLGLFASLLLLGAAVVAVAPAWSAQVADRLRSRKLWAMLVGVGVFVVVPMAVGLLFVSIVGIPLAIVVTAAYVGMLLLAVAFVSYRVGSWLLDRLRRPAHRRWSALAVGALVVSLGMALPVVGWLVTLVVVLTGIGALALEWGTRRLRVPVA